MKRYYRENGDLDEIKTICKFLQKALIWFFIVYALCIFAYRDKPKDPPKPTYWKNWDSTRSLSDVKAYDYDNGLIIYRSDYTGPNKVNSIGRLNSQDGITLQVDGASIHLDMEPEELLDQLTEDADFYEYFERNMD